MPPGTHANQNRVWDPSELQLQVNCELPNTSARIDLRSSEEQQDPLTADPSIQTHICFYFGMVLFPRQAELHAYKHTRTHANTPLFLT